MKIIGHLDMDAFFAAIEERDNPRWAGMPIVVGSDPAIGRGVVSTANYEARKFGVHSAMPISQAVRLAPQAIFLPVNGRRYGQISQRIMEIVSRHTPTIEQASVDEAYIDLSRCGSWAKAKMVCRRIKQEILKKEGLTCSIGLAANKLVAKIASDFKKPDGLTVVAPRKATQFLAPLGIRKIPGIGPKAEGVLKRMGLDTVGQVQALTEADLYRILGEWGLDLYETVRGKGSDELMTKWTAKSIGEQETFDTDTLNSAFIIERLSDMCQSIARQFKRDGFKLFRRVVLTIRWADFKTCTRSHTLQQPAQTPTALKTEMLRLVLPFFDRRENPKKQLIRLAGIRIEELE